MIMAVADQLSGASYHKVSDTRISYPIRAFVEKNEGLENVFDRIDQIDERIMKSIESIGEEESHLYSFDIRRNDSRDE